MPTDQRLGFGLIGLGRHGARYAEHLLRDVPAARLVAVCRRDEAQGKSFADKNSCRYYRDVESLLGDPDIDAVVITTPPHLHAPITVQAARAGKHVLCEKPMSRNVAECDDMLQAARDAGIKLGIGQTMRYTPIFETLRKRLPEIGELHGLHVCMRQEQSVHEWHLDPAISGGGCVTEIGVHVFDALRHISGQRIVRAMATSMDTHEAGVETYVGALCWLEGGAVSLIDIAKCVDGRLLRFDAVGSQGQLIANVTSSTLERVHQRTITPLDAPANIPTIAPLLADFCDAVLNDSTPPVSGEHGRYTLAVSEAFYRSFASGQPEDVA
ncbi:Gfo/Idh/MocA family oxidoreductase [Candidatus Poribacteria bacterium]|nr:Gfo/Idh/MocA family oxidoreductase [Candidatus Poribacteria bacterium]